MKIIKLLSLTIATCVYISSAAVPTEALTPVLPNAALTPGATNPAVTQATIKKTICVSGYTGTIRPPSSYTTALKKKQLASGYSYQGDMNLSSYEEDHLISLELGGSPKDSRNLWPEPYASATGARTKDLVENKLHALVCAGKVPLRTAQNAIASNWWSAYNFYVLGKASNPETAPVATPSPSVTIAPTPTSKPSNKITSLVASGPSNALVGATILVNLRATDSNGQGVSGMSISYSDSAKTLSGVTELTDSNGQVNLTINLAQSVNYLDLFTFTADSTAVGIYSVSLSSPEPTPTPTPTTAPKPVPAPTATQTSQSLVSPGAFCAATQAGAQGVSASGATYTCKSSATDSRLRWRQ